MVNRKHARRIIASLLAVTLVWVLARYVLGVDIDNEGLKLLIVATVMTSYLNSYFKRGGEKLLRRIGI